MLFKINKKKLPFSESLATLKSGLRRYDLSFNSASVEKTQKYTKVVKTKTSLWECSGISPLNLPAWGGPTPLIPSIESKNLQNIHFNAILYCGSVLLNLHY